MPFTPYHFGPGLLGKAIVARWYSWTAFALTQVFIDCETLYYLSRNEYPLHRKLHTFVGATLVGLLTAALLIGIKLFAQRCLPEAVEFLRTSLPALQAEATTKGLLVGGFVGGATHPLLDGLMHRDIRPFLPFTESNPLLGLITVQALEMSCVIAGAIGFVLTTIWVYFDLRSR